MSTAYRMPGSSARWRHLNTRHLNQQVRHSSQEFKEVVRLMPKRPAPRDFHYRTTADNLLIGKDTRVIFQGFTGRQATVNARESIAWGTQIVGGTKPGFTGEHPELGLPVLPSVRKAMEVLKPHATGIYVPANMAAAAIEEAIEAEVPLIVAVAEHIPLHQLLRIHDVLRHQTASRLVGANSPGIISVTGRCRIGFQPLASYMAGPVAVAAKSGTLSYEAVTSLTEAGIGQSLCIGIGGDVVAGTSFVDALTVFEKDEATKAIVLIGEVGGTAEVDAANWIREYRHRVANPKPIAALVAGSCAVEGKIMGHAGAWNLIGEPSVKNKRHNLEDVGVTLVNHPSAFGKVMKTILTDPSWTMRPVTPAYRSDLRLRRVTMQEQRRQIHLQGRRVDQLLREKITPKFRYMGPDRTLLGIAVARSSGRPCIFITNEAKPLYPVRAYFDYPDGPTKETIQKIIDTDRLKKSYPVAVWIASMWSLFKDMEAMSISATVTDNGLINTQMLLDPAVYLHGSKKSELAALRDTTMEDPLSIEGEKYNLVYVPVNLGPGPYVGTLVNGAGLAMNTIDCLVDAGLSVTNFLDTGGKATSETVKESLRLILSDERVKAVFVNIFGGLTKCDMIAEGVLDALRELKTEVPLVVRLRGTREEEAEAVMATVDEGMKVYCEPNFDRAVELLKQLVVGKGPTVVEWLEQSSTKPETSQQT